MMRPAPLLLSLLVVPVGASAVDDAIFADGFDRAAPVVLYTDIVSGPTTGGEGGKGAYLSLFGRNFGTGGLGTRIKVYVGTAEVDNYRYLGPSRGRDDVQQVTVQLGALGGQAAGVALPVTLVVDGLSSTIASGFTINPGRMIFVDPVNGDDATGVVGDIAHPFRRVQAGGDFSAGAWGRVRPGDVIVLRGGNYVDRGFEDYFLRFMIRTNGLPDRSSGTAPTGAVDTGPITLTAYPNEVASIAGTATNNPSGALAGLNGENYPLAGKWIVIANLRIEGGGYDGPVNQEIHGDHWRVVNNELTATTGVTSGASPSRMGGITGNGLDAHWLGNHSHDIQGSENEAHGIYIDGEGSYDIAWNDIHDIHSGKGIQLFANGGNGSDVIDDVAIHHNRVSRVTQFGINVADGSRDRIAIYDNIVTEAAAAGLRFNTVDLHGCRVYNNTFHGNNTASGDVYGVLMNDWGLPADALDVRDNIFVARSGTHYFGGSVGFDGTEGVFARNLWFGGDDGAALDADALVADPHFVAPGSDFHLAAGSPAIDAGSAATAALVTTDYDARARPSGAAMDLGALEYSP